MLVSDRRDLANSVREGDEAQVLVVGEGDSVAGWVNHLREQQAEPRFGVRAEDFLRSVGPHDFVEVCADALEQGLVVLVWGVGLRVGVKTDEHAPASPAYDMFDRRGKSVEGLVPIVRPFWAEELI